MGFINQLITGGHHYDNVFHVFHHSITFSGGVFPTLQHGLPELLSRRMAGRPADSVRPSETANVLAQLGFFVCLKCPFYIMGTRMKIIFVASYFI